MADPETLRERRLDAMLEAWEEARAGDGRVSPSGLCRDHPELEGELRERIARLERIGRMMDRETGTGEISGEDLLPAREVELTLSLQELSFLERGGMGILGRARDTRLGREVVVKFMRSACDVPGARERFLNEARIAASLDHPGVLPVYGFGQTGDSPPFYAMRHVSGRTLEEEIAEHHRGGRHGRRGERHRALARLLGHFASVCYTIAYAHGRRILHCDLKPRNILLGSFGETYVIDWGLSVDLASGTPGRTPPGAGTRGYSHPRQLGGGGPPEPAWDIYSLGAILHAILTGHLPGEAVHPVPGRVPAALMSISRHALGRGGGSYRQAREVAEDVERYLTGEPVRIHTETMGERVVRWQRSHQGATKIAGALLLLLLAVLTAGLFSLWHFAGAMEKQTRESLGTAAEFAAQTVALEMNNRWQALRLASRDARLLEALVSLEEGDEAHRTLQNRIRHHRNAYRELRSASWFLCDAGGVQVARSPESRSLGKNYAHRDYFHGNGRDYPETVLGDPPAIERAHHSVVYRSTSDHSLKVAYSVPVLLNPGSDGERFLGVIGMSVRLGEFSFLRREALRGHRLLLVDLREDWVEGAARRGLLLHHPGLGALVQEERERRPRLDGILVQRLRALGAEDPGFHLEDFADPLFPSGRGTLAAFARVPREDEGGFPVDSGWAVIVQEEIPAP